MSYQTDDKLRFIENFAARKLKFKLIQKPTQNFVISVEPFDCISSFDTNCQYKVRV